MNESSGEARGTYKQTYVHTYAASAAFLTYKQTYMHTYAYIHTHTYKHTYTHKTRIITMRTKINFADEGFITKTMFLWAFLVFATTLLTISTLLNFALYKLQNFVTVTSFY